MRSKSCKKSSKLMPNYTENHFLHSTVKQLRAYIFNFDLEIFSYTKKMNPCYQSKCQLAKEIRFSYVLPSQCHSPGPCILVMGYYLAAMELV